MICRDVEMLPPYSPFSFFALCYSFLSIEATYVENPMIQYYEFLLSTVKHFKALRE